MDLELLDGPWEDGTEDGLKFPACYCAFCFIRVGTQGPRDVCASGSWWALRGEDSGSSEEGEDLLYGLVEVEDMRASGEGSEMGAKASWKFRGNVLCRKNGSHPVTFPIPEGSVGNA